MEEPNLVVVGVWCTFMPDITSKQTASVLNAWVKHHYVARIVHVRAGHDAHVVPALVTVLSAMPPDVPVIIVSMCTTALLSTDWPRWKDSWMAADRKLWCTGLGCTGPGKAPALVRSLHTQVTLRVAPTSASAVPCWGVLGGVVGALMQHLPSLQHMTLDAAIGALWCHHQVVFVHPASVMGPLTWVWCPMWPLQPLPRAEDFSGPLTRLQRVMPAMQQPPDRVMALAGAAMGVMSTDCRARTLSFSACALLFTLFIIVVIVVGTRA